MIYVFDFSLTFAHPWWWEYFVREKEINMLFTLFIPEFKQLNNSPWILHNPVGVYNLYIILYNLVLSYAVGIDKWANFDLI